VSAAVRDELPDREAQFGVRKDLIASTKWHEMWHTHPERAVTKGRVSFADGMGPEWTGTP
jgi:hypothetical protein